MYSVAVKREFHASHFLVGGDWGKENKPHAHHYHVELKLEGSVLNEHGYLVDIVEIEKMFNTVIAHYREQTLNALSEFRGLNPSIEHFARIFCERFTSLIKAPNITAITVTIWENTIAYASFRKEL
ncbi:MAG: 6-carboxytetrahydropterin synthase [candidate division WOR-3 bacterium]|nr:MAG: 6-carboxytetrahydropterin synthase [candidate division WOR-3 bacterium]